MRLFEDANVVSASAAANAFGLGFPVPSPSMDLRQSHSQAQVIIPNLSDEVDEPEAFLRTARKRQDSLPHRTDLTSPTTLRAPGLPRTTSHMMPPSPRLTAVSFPAPHPSSPPMASQKPASPSWYATPTGTRFPLDSQDVSPPPVPTSPSLPTLSYDKRQASAALRHRNRANTAPSQDTINQNHAQPGGGTTAPAMISTSSAPVAGSSKGEESSPPSRLVAAGRRNRSGTISSDAAEKPHHRKVSVLSFLHRALVQVTVVFAGFQQRHHWFT